MWLASSDALMTAATVVVVYSLFCLGWLQRVIIFFPVQPILADPNAGNSWEREKNNGLRGE